MMRGLMSIIAMGVIWCALLAALGLVARLAWVLLTAGWQAAGWVL